MMVAFGSAKPCLMHGVMVAGLSFGVRGIRGLKQPPRNYSTAPIKTQACLADLQLHLAWGNLSAPT